MSTFDYSQLASTGLFGDDPDQLRKLMEQLQPSEEDRKRASRDGMMQFGFTLLANSRRGQEFEALGHAGLAGAQASQSALDRFGKDRGQMITQAAGLQKIGREALNDRRLDAMMQRYTNPGGAPQPSIGPPPLAPPPIGPIGMRGPPAAMAGPEMGPPEEQPQSNAPPMLQGPQMPAPSSGLPPGTPPISQATQGPGLPGLRSPPPMQDLLVLARSGEKGKAMAEIIEKNTKIEFSRDGVLTQGGQLVGKEENGRWIVYPDGNPRNAYTLDAPPGWVAQKVDEARQIAAATEGEKRVQVEATVDGKPRMIWVRQADLVSPPGAPGGPSVVPPGGRVTLNLKDASREEAARALQEILGGGGGRPGVSDVGVSPTPLQTEQQKGQFGVTEHFQKVVTDLGVKRVGEYQERATKMTPLISIVDDLQAREDSFGGIYGGAPANVKLQLAQWANATFGLKKDLQKATGQSEAYDAGISELKQAIARSFPGSQSDAELKALSQSLPERILTPEGRAYIRDTIRRKTEHAINVKIAAEEYFVAHKGDMTGFAEPKAPPPPVLWKPIEKFKATKTATALQKQAFAAALAAKDEKLMAEVIAGGGAE